MTGYGEFDVKHAVNHKSRVIEVCKACTSTVSIKMMIKNFFVIHGVKMFYLHLCFFSLFYFTSSVWQKTFPSEGHFYYVLQLNKIQRKCYSPNHCLPLYSQCHLQKSDGNHPEQDLQNNDII